MARLADPFFITGLPRSRTAWMAAFFTDGDVFCHHEYLKRCRSVGDFIDGMYCDGKRIGNSDSGLALTDFQSRFPDSKTVIIERSYRTVSESLRNMGIDVSLGFLVNRLRDVRGFRVGFNNLDTMMPAICEYLELPYNKTRHLMFQEFQIETNDFVAKPEAFRVWVGG